MFGTDAAIGFGDETGIEAELEVVDLRTNG